MPEVANVPSINTNKVPNKRFLVTAIVSAVLLALTVSLVVYFYSRGLPKFYQSNKSLGQITPTPKSTATPIPSPTPATGPGPWACDPLGTCSRYNDSSVTSGCPKTFADTNCLNQCGNKAVQCSKF